MLTPLRDLEDSIGRLSEYYKIWRLNINVNKIKVVSFNRKQHIPDLSLLCYLYDTLLRPVLEYCNEVCLLKNWKSYTDASVSYSWECSDQLLI